MKRLLILVALFIFGISSYAAKNVKLANKALPVYEIKNKIKSPLCGYATATSSSGQIVTVYYNCCCGTAKEAKAVAKYIAAQL